MNISHKAPDFHDSYRTAMAFLSNPCFLWRSSRVEHKRATVELAFAGHLSYDRKQGYRTAKASLPFQTIQRLSNGQADSYELNEEMVRAAGIEPALLYRNKILSLACLPIPPRPLT